MVGARCGRRALRLAPAGVGSSRARARFHTVQALFSAADVDNNGQLTFDEFAEMVRRTVPTLSNDQISGMFVEALRTSKNREAIEADAFAKVALRYGMLRGNGQPGAPPDLAEGGDKGMVLKESLNILKEMWAVLISKVRDRGVRGGRKCVAAGCVAAGCVVEGYAVRRGACVVRYRELGPVCVCVAPDEMLRVRRAKSRIISHLDPDPGGEHAWWRRRRAGDGAGQGDGGAV